jgi:hypothetical protein
MISRRRKGKNDAVNPDRRPHVVIVGGGFGGLQAAKALAGVPVRVTLIDRRNHHLFQPLLYQVATAVLSPADIAQPIRSVLRKELNIEVVLGDVVAVDPAARKVTLEDGTIPYDYLILAAGARHAYFGHDEWEPLAPGLKSLEDALDVRRRILLSFEEAERETDPERLQALMTFAPHRHARRSGHSRRGLRPAAGDISATTLPPGAARPAAIGSRRQARSTGERDRTRVGARRR